MLFKFKEKGNKKMQENYYSQLDKIIVKSKRRRQAKRMAQWVLDVVTLAAYALAVTVVFFLIVGK